MKLTKLLEGQAFRCLSGAVDVDVSGLAHDSRKVKPGYAFFCLSGRAHDGHDFAMEAVSRGAKVVIGERPVPGLGASLTFIITPSTRKAMALTAAAFRGHPSSKLRLFAVTGTNGKTTVNHLVEAILKADGRRPGLIGTVENHLGHRNVASNLTTPDALEVQSSLAAMARAGLTQACLEVSSHALAGHRLAGCEIDVGILTNVARDHLDFHEGVAAYAQTKLSLFTNLGGGFASGRTKPGPVYAVLNSDDSFFDSFRRKLMVPYLTYGAVRAGHVKLLGAVLGARGSHVRVAFERHGRGLEPAGWVKAHAGWPEGEACLHFPHPGRHNIRNLLAALAVAWAEGCSWEAACLAARVFAGVRGRWDVVSSPNGVAGVVDFAHNPDGLLQALETARLAASGRVILVFGCEGQKDRGKRPVMGAIAARLADHVVLTSDNTFKEQGRQILNDIESGLANPIAALDAAHQSLSRRLDLAEPGHRASYEIVTDRREAIFRAAAEAHTGDIVVVAGRGHDVKLVYGSDVRVLDDREALEAALASAHGYSHSMVDGGLEVTS